MDRSRQVLIALLALWALAWAPLAQAAFDLHHPAWDALLKQRNVVAPGGVAPAVRYAALRSDPKPPRGDLASVSAVTPREYAGWTRNDRLAFLNNAYNAFTIEPVPRIHVAVVCASVGCPMLRDEAHVGERLETQRDNAIRRFLSDRSRNCFDGDNGVLSVSKLFDWYHADFEHGHQGIDSLQGLFIRYVDVPGTTPAARAELRAGRFKLRHLDDDWSLNDAR